MSPPCDDERATSAEDDIREREGEREVYRLADVEKVAGELQSGEALLVNLAWYGRGKREQ